MWDDSDFSITENGGGFMKSDAEKPGTSKPPEQRKARNLVAVSVDQLLKLYNVDHGLVIHNQPVAVVTIVGKVESVNEQSTSSTFVLQDESDSGIEVNFWTLDEKDSFSAPQAVVEGSYVRVYGQPRSKEGRVFISAFKVLPVTDFMDVVSHNLEVLYHCKMLERVKHNYAFESTDAKVTAGGEPVDLGVNTNSGLSHTQQIILNSVSQVQSPEGISFNEVCAAFRTLRADLIRKELEFLTQEGHIYTTIDEDHFRSTNM